MQPDQQNQTQPPSSNIPEYLHIDPVASQPKPPRRWMLGLILSALVVGVLIAGGVFYGLWLQREPERRFYGALDNLMQAPYIIRDIKVETTKENIEIHAKSDFSDPATPITRYTHTSGPSNKTTGEAFVAPETLIVRIDEHPSSKIKKGAWYVISNQSDKTKYDQGSLSTILNNYLTMVVQGNFNNEQRQAILGFIQQNSLYTINKNYPGENNHTIYEITINYTELTKLSTMLDNLLDINLKKPIQIPESKAKVWIDNASGRISKVQEKIERSTDKLTATNTTIYEYPDTASVKRPEGAAYLKD